METRSAPLRIRLYHREQKKGIFSEIPNFLLINDNNILIGRGFNCQLKLKDARVSRCHAILEPYLDKDKTCLQFCFKNLSTKSKIKINGLRLRYLQQIPLTLTNRITFCGFQMEINVEPGISLEDCQCVVTVSESPLYHEAEAEETDEQDMTHELEEQTKAIHLR
ncbi:TRAF-interacting protein with FHA domain-containing protein B [Lissotriton helveticus]